MSMSKDQVEENFKLSNEKKRELDIVPKVIMEYLQFMEYKIRKEFKSFSILNLCGGNRGNFEVDPNFERAFESMNLEEKAEYYSKYIGDIDKIEKKRKSSPPSLANEAAINEEGANILIPLKIGKGGNSFSESKIEINDLKVRSKGKTIFDIDLRNYLMRKSKKKDSVYVLEAIKSSSPETVKFEFLSNENQARYLPIVKEAVEEACYQNIEKQFEMTEKRRTMVSSNENSKHLKLQTSKTTSADSDSRNILNIANNTLLNSRKNDKLNRSIVEDVVKSRDDQELDEQLTEIIDEQNEEMERISMEKGKFSLNTPTFTKNIFRIILPTFSLKNMNSLHHYGSIYESNQCKMYAYQNVKKYSEFKMQITVSLPIKTVCKAIINTQLYKYWHPEVLESQIKLKISPENSCIAYEKIRALSEWYKERDYLLLVHLFETNGVYYIVSKSIENSNFVPFQSITRGNFYYLVWKIEKEGHSNQKCRVMMEMKIDHNGLLNRANHKELCRRYLKGFENLEKYFESPENQKKLKEVLVFDWSVQDRDMSQVERSEILNNSVRTYDFDAGSEISEELDLGNQTFYSIEDLSEEEMQEENTKKEIERDDHEVEPSQIEMAKSQIVMRGNEEENIKLDREGLVILPKDYLKKKQVLKPFDCQKNLMELPYENIVCKDDWVVEKGGGMKLVNQVKIDAQNNVIKFIMKTLKKNLFSGKGLLNISLPVEIFNVDSNLQRLCQGMSLAPELLEPAVKTNDNLERFKKVLAFGLSNTVIYIDVEKPFNPILGETYQGHIRGCPIFAEQISHHPPITSIYFAGRGYKITGNFEGKVKVHMNSGEGSNDGFYHVKFDDGNEIVFAIPPGEISGLAMGDRKFNVKGTGVYFDEKNGYFCEMIMENRGGMFGKKRDLADQIDGEILRVKQSFISKLKAVEDFSKIPSPSKEDIIEKLGVLSGRWPLFLKIDDVTYYDVVKDIPDKMVHEIYPLPSNSNYREDLLYRKKGDLSRSQIEKERLEVLQRGDRKLRGKGH